MGSRELQESELVKSALGFIEDLVNKYEWTHKKRRQEIIQALGKIRNKEEDPCLYMGIVGEFNSGKSTFINGVLRDRLLYAAALPATAITTIIQYGETLDVAVKYKNGFQITFQREGDYLLGQYSSSSGFPNERAKFTEFLRIVTSHPEVTKELEQVTLFHPSEVLKSGLVLVDTPGSNAAEEHTQLAQWAVKELCDGVIVLIPADFPLAESLVDFLNNHILEVIQRCIFVMTKIDLIEAEERKRLVENVQQRLPKIKNNSARKIYPISVLGALKQMAQGQTGPVQKPAAPLEIDDSLAGFLEAERGIYQILREQKLIMQLDKLSLLITELLEGLKNDVEQIRKESEMMHQANQIMDIHLDRRGDVATQFIAQDALQESKLRELKASIQADLDQLEDHLRQLTEMRKKLGEMD